MEAARVLRYGHYERLAIWHCSTSTRLPLLVSCLRPGTRRHKPSKQPKHQPSRRCAEQNARPYSKSQLAEDVLDVMRIVGSRKFRPGENIFDFADDRKCYRSDDKHLLEDRQKQA